jgi:hypothetical protein
MELVNDTLMFLSIPKMLIREVPMEKYKYGISNNILEFIERLPRNERKICKLQYIKNKKT